MDKASQREMLHHVAERVVINPEGKVIQVRLRPPFTCLRSLVPDRDPMQNEKRGAQKSKTSSISATRSKWKPFGAPKGN